jgi:hypothetical protein
MSWSMMIRLGRRVTGEREAVDMTGSDDAKV